MTWLEVRSFRLFRLGTKKVESKEKNMSPSCQNKLWWKLRPHHLSAKHFPCRPPPSASHQLRWGRAIFKMHTSRATNERSYLFIVTPFNCSFSLWRQRPGLTLPLNLKSLGWEGLWKVTGAVYDPQTGITVPGNTSRKTVNVLRNSS